MVNPTDEETKTYQGSNNWFIVVGRLISEKRNSNFVETWSKVPGLSHIYVPGPLMQGH